MEDEMEDEVKKQISVLKTAQSKALEMLDLELVKSISLAIYPYVCLLERI